LVFLKLEQLKSLEKKWKKFKEAGPAGCHAGSATACHLAPALLTAAPTKYTSSPPLSSVSVKRRRKNLVSLLLLPAPPHMPKRHCYLPRAASSLTTATSFDFLLIVLQSRPPARPAAQRSAALLQAATVVSCALHHRREVPHPRAAVHRGECSKHRDVAASFLLRGHRTIAW
jgi:hypothetical protein